MKTYTIRITEKHTYRYDVKAKDYVEATDKAMMEHENGNNLTPESIDDAKVIE